MSHRTRLLILLPWIVLLPVPLGCTPPSPADLELPGVTVPITAPETPSEEKPPATETIAEETASAKIEDAVLYDSGYEEDNSSCMVCHLDFETELISSIHMEAGLTCMACHGDSEDHRADEYNIIRPDVIWGRTEMDVFCKQCHEKHKYPSKVEAFHQEWDSRRRPNGRYVQQNSACMDCHGDHAIIIAEGDFK